MSTLGNAKQIMNELGEPFARALAVFIGELDGQLAGGRKEGSNSDEDLPDAIPFDELPASVRHRLAESREAAKAAIAAGTPDRIDFNGGSPGQRVGLQIRRALLKQGISQKTLAERLKVDPAVVCRVLKDPDRSKVITLRKMADALDVELREIIA